PRYVGGQTDLLCKESTKKSAFQKKKSPCYPIKRNRPIVSVSCFLRPLRFRRERIFHSKDSREGFRAWLPAETEGAADQPYARSLYQKNQPECVREQGAESEEGRNRYDYVGSADHRCLLDGCDRGFRVSPQLGLRLFRP